MWAYIGGRWGDETAARLFRSALQEGMEPAFQRILGLAPKDFSREWHQAVRDAYGTILAKRAPPEEAGRRVLTRRTTNARANLAPSLSPDGSRVAFLSTRGLFGFDLYVADASTGANLKRLYSASSDPHSDALRFLDSSGAWSPDGRKLAFVGFARGTNQILILDIESRDIERRIELPGVGSLSSPAWSPDGRRLAVSGTRNGIADLYLFDLETGRTRQLTDDRHADLQPVFSPDGKTLAFVSDRGEGTDFETLAYAPMRIFLLELETARIQPVPLFPRALHTNPQFSPDGRELYFIANPEGVSDLFRAALDGAITRVTHVATGIAGITDLSPALTVARLSGSVMFSLLNGDDYEIHALPAERRPTPIERAAAESDRAAGILPPATSERAGAVAAYLDSDQPIPPPSRERPADRYRPKLSLALVGPTTVGVGVDRFGYGLGGAINAYFTDLLGDHQVGVSLQAGAVSEDLSGTLGGGVVYLNLADRLQWGAGASHIPSRSGFAVIRQEPIRIDSRMVIADVVEQVIQTTTADELALFAQYPLSRTRRFEVTGAYTRLDFDREVRRFFFVGGARVDEDTDSLPAPSALDLYQTSVAYVGDNSFFGLVSPARGGRMRLEAGSVFGTLEYQTALADLRRYFFFRPWTLAVRALHFGRYGTDAESPRLFPLYLGRETLVRGYGIDDIEGSECTPVGRDSACPEFDRLVGSRVGVANLELRFPLLGTEDYGLIEAPFFPTEAAAFLDGGVAWSKGESPDFKFERKTIERVPVFSAGIALRTAIGGVLPIQIYYAVPFQRPKESGVFGIFIAPGW